MPRRKVSDDYRNLAEERGFVWLGPEVSNSVTPTEWQCPEGHRWQATYESMRSGNGCPQCSGHLRKTAEDYNALAAKQGLDWLGPMPQNVHRNTWWKCHCGYRWRASYANIKQGHGCPACARCAPKTPQDYHTLAEERGFNWVGDLPRNIEEKTTWECRFHHRWEASFHAIRLGNGCPYCYGNARLTAQDYHSLAERRGFRWVGGNVPASNHTPTTWECGQGHRWKASYHNVDCRASGCPQCRDMVNGARVSRQQREICSFVGGELNYPVGRRCIDVAIPHAKIAIEYDSFYYHGGREERDAMRIQELLAAGWRILCIRSNKQVPDPKAVGVAVAALLAGETWQEIVLPDWGQGPTQAKQSHSRHQGG